MLSSVSASKITFEECWILILLANGRQGENPLGRSVAYLYHWHTSLYSTHTTYRKHGLYNTGVLRLHHLHIKKMASLLFFINSS